ncbi:hypothetical protein pdam_00019412 [Pocillopora damicornis]|uniref:Uncharacterized protein n=1 Tax=Pocillopora damicornis TaxID=46731 RepID=A0A3M6U4N1_POCDA|nr:hypothetical protein pdam_00019412 [Pocillopora damicornis]
MQDTRQEYQKSFSNLTLKNFLLRNFIQGNWQKVYHAPVCFEAKSGSYGSFNETKSGKLKTMNLIHRSGQIRCSSLTLVSYW